MLKQSLLPKSNTINYHFNLLVYILLVSQVHNQFQPLQIIKCDQLNQTIIDLSSDFSIMVTHNNYNNTLIIYGNKQQNMKSIMFQQNQQINLDAQEYQNIQITNDHHFIYLGAKKTSDIKILAYDLQKQYFQINKTLNFNQHGSIFEIQSHPFQKQQIIVCFNQTILIINTSKNKSESIIQTLQLPGEGLRTVSISKDAQFLATGGTNQMIYIYKKNDIGIYEAFNYFWEGSKIKEIKFVDIFRSSDIQYYLIVELSNSYSIYLCEEDSQFNLAKKIYEKGYLNNHMNIIIQEDSLGINLVEVYKINQEQNIQKTQQLNLYKIQKAYFDDSSNLIIQGSLQIIIYRNCFIDYCQQCEYVSNYHSLNSFQTQQQYVCVNCTNGYQPKLGISCMQCTQYPKICLNCIQPNVCTECLQGYKLREDKICILCHIQYCLTCQQPQICKACEKDYELDIDENICISKFYDVPLLGIIIGTLIGAIIVITVCLVILFEKAKKRKAKEQGEREQNEKKYRKFRERQKTRQQRKKSFITESLISKNYYESYLESDESMEEQIK